MDFQTYGFLLAKGARWGDLECMDYEDIVLDLQNRHDEIQQAKARRLVSIDKQRKFVMKLSERPVHTHVLYVKLPFKRDFSKKRACIGCKKFAIHSNPPSHFTDEDKMHCCAYCNVTHGKKHGGSCEKNCI
jgi:hypothetical protein